MKKLYKGYWSFAPSDECITYTVRAHNEDEAWALLVQWAMRHNGLVDNPTDVEVELILTKAQKKVNEIAKTIAAVVALLMMIVGCMLGFANDQLPYHQFVAQIVVAITLMLGGYGILRKMGGEYNV
jgi:hypothetical protein